jgi:GT2 family glycosyltransferase
MIRTPRGEEAENLNINLANISVIIPAYNRANLIGQTLKSFLNQTLSAKEIVVVDDGSTDGTAEVVERIAEDIEDRRLKIGNSERQGAGSGEPGALDSRRSIASVAPATLAIKATAGRLPRETQCAGVLDLPQIRVIRQANAGPGAARNRGLAESTGEFIHFFDSDDIAAPNKHEVQLKALLETGADIAYGAWVKGRFAPPMADSGSLRTEEGLEEKAEKLKSETLKNVSTEESKFADLPVSESLTGSSSIPSASPATRHQLPATIHSGFTPEGPVLQARGLPEGDLVRALLTNWSVVPHACLFRRSILEKTGGFPEDIWVGEDQLLFLRCLMAGAKVVHTPGTMVFYRLGDAGKLTESKEGQRRRVVDWGRFLLKAKKEIEDRPSEVSFALHGPSRSEIGGAAEPPRAEEGGLIAEDGDRRSEIGDRVGTTNHTNHTNFLTTDSTDSTDGHNQAAGRPLGRLPQAAPQGRDERERTSQIQEAGPRPGSRAGAAFSNPSTSELARNSENTSLTRSAIGPASSPDTRNSLLVTTTPSAWFGFRLRAYEAWRDLRDFFPGEYLDLERGLEDIWKRSKFSVFGFQCSVFLRRKWGGVMQRFKGHRVKRCFCVGGFSSREEGLFPKN